MRLPTTAAVFRPLLIALCALWLAGPAAAQSPPVREAQARLEALGHSPGGIDGVMGPQTRDALREFQRKNNLRVSGELDWETRLALSASVRSIGDAKPAPKPRSAPVPEVAMSVLPPPGSGAIDDSVAAAPDIAVAAETTVVPETASASAKPKAPVDAERPDRPAREAVPVPAVPPDGDYPLLRLGPAIGLALAAAGAWLALLVWMIRQRRRPAPPAADATPEAASHDLP